MSLSDRRAAIQRLLTEPPANYAGAIDGQMGPQTLAAFERLAAAVEGAAPSAPRGDTPAAVPGLGDDGASRSTALQPNAWPLEANAQAFFGYPPNLTLVTPPYPMRMNYDGAWHPITAINCNIKVAPSLRRILAAILAHYGSPDAVRAVGLDVYDGCYADRNVRGRSNRSMHAYGAAIDFDAEHNPLGATTGRMPAEAVAIFTAEGWRWGGHYTGRKDWMHFEACV